MAIMFKNLPNVKMSAMRLNRKIDECLAAKNAETLTNNLKKAKECDGIVMSFDHVCKYCGAKSTTHLLVENHADVEHIRMDLDSEICPDCELLRREIGQFHRTDLPF